MISHAFKSLCVTTNWNWLATWYLTQYAYLQNLTILNNKKINIWKHEGDLYKHEPKSVLACMYKYLSVEKTVCDWLQVPHT